MADTRVIQVNVKLTYGEANKLDRWRATQRGVPTRQEAIRMLIDEARVDAKRDAHDEDGERIAKR